MSKSIESLKKDMEEIFAALSPEGKAKYAFDETLGIAMDCANGKDPTSRERALDSFIDRHVSSQQAAGYFRYLSHLRKLEGDKMAVDWLMATLVGYQREADLLDVTLDAFELVAILSKSSPAFAEKFPGGFDKIIEGMQKRRQAVQVVIDEYKKSDIWEKLGIQLGKTIYDDCGIPYYKIAKSKIEVVPQP